MLVQVVLSADAENDLDILVLLDIREGGSCYSEEFVRSSGQAATQRALRVKLAS